MGQFVGEKFLPGPRTKACGITKKHVRTDGESASLETIVEVGCFSAGMEPHMREIGAEPRAHLGSHVAWEWLAATATTLDPLLGVVVDRPARMSHIGIASDTSGWYPANISRRRVAMLSDPTPNPANDLLGDCVGFTLSGIVCRPDSEF